MNLLLIAVLGGAVSFAFRKLEHERDQETKHAQREREGQKVLRRFREDFLRDCLRAYHSTKASRRMLSRDGLTVKAPQEQQLTNEQLSGYETEMKSINEAQLAFERLVAEVRNTPDAFAESRELRHHLRTMESYLRKIHREYEMEWRRMETDPTSARLESLPKLCDFTGRYSETKYGKEFCAAKDKVLRMVRRDLLPLTILEGLAPNKSMQRTASGRR